MKTQTRTAIYASVSTTDQTCENQLSELRRYCEGQTHRRPTQCIFPTLAPNTVHVAGANKLLHFGGELLVGNDLFRIEDREKPSTFVRLKPR